MKTLLYTGLDLSEKRVLAKVAFPEKIADSLLNSNDIKIVHIPFIRVVFRSIYDPEIQKALLFFNSVTHLIFTSKQAVEAFFSYAFLSDISIEQIRSKCIGAVGLKTAAHIESWGVIPTFTAQNETAEGVIEELQRLNLNRAYILWPRSFLSRPVITDWLFKERIHYHAPAFYDTLFQMPSPLPDLKQFDEIMFTSPSTVDAFLAAYHELPKNKVFHTIGVVTANYLYSHQAKNNH
jgi:uroporphyrinogen-III synthase